eukprot:g14017.t1
MSRRQERLCRVVNVIDVTGCTLSKVICKEFDQRAEKMMQRLEKLVPDLTAGNWVINAPWIMQKIFPWAKRALKIKVDNWFLCNGDGEQDPSLLSVVEVSQLRELREFRYRVKEESEKCDANMHYIGRGQVLEKAMEVRSGQRVCWKFLVMAGGILLPPPEIQFSVVGIWDLDDEDEVEEVLRRKPGARSGQGTAKPAVKPAMVVEDGDPASWAPFPHQPGGLRNHQARAPGSHSQDSTGDGIALLCFAALLRDRLDQHLTLRDQREGLQRQLDSDKQLLNYLETCYPGIQAKRAAIDEIINLTPTEPLYFYSLCEDCEKRFSEEDVERIGALVKQHLLGLDKEAAWPHKNSSREFTLAGQLLQRPRRTALDRAAPVGGSPFEPWDGDGFLACSAFGVAAFAKLCAGRAPLQETAREKKVRLRKLAMWNAVQRKGMTDVVGRSEATVDIKVNLMKPLGIEFEKFDTEPNRAWVSAILED